MSNTLNELTLDDISMDRLSILVVDDDDFQRHLLVRLVKKLGASEVFQATDGVEALELVKDLNTDFNLILTDLDMPNMDGMEFIRMLGEQNAATAIAITSAMDETFLSSVQTMCNGYGIEPLGVLQKPITADGVKALMEKARKKSSSPKKSYVGNLQSFSLGEILEGIDLRQFDAFYQPKVDLTTGHIVSAEALARWRHPEHGTIAPYAFIDKLEKAGKINDLTFFMIERAARACCAWSQAGLDIDISVNLSLTSLTDNKLADKIHEVVVSTGLKPERMTLEITETAAMTEMAPALENLARLRMRGFGLSIDDFGTGFASMQQLSRIPFTELKIDRSFVSALRDKREARAIVESSVDIANRLGIKAVAEGVETGEELYSLQEAGCHLAQGYLISRPVPLTEFVSICREDRNS